MMIQKIHKYWNNPNIEIVISARPIKKVDISKESSGNDVWYQKTPYINKKKTIPIFQCYHIQYSVAESHADPEFNL